MFKQGMLKTILMVLVLLSIPEAARAATLAVDKGEVRVRRAGGFRVVADGASIQAGEQILVSPDGKARIIYGNGCVTRLLAGVWRVAEEKLCDPAATGASLSGDAVSLKDSAPIYEGGLNSTQLAFVGMAIALGAGVAIGASVSGDNDEEAIIIVPQPVSP